MKIKTDTALCQIVNCANDALLFKGDTVTYQSLLEKILPPAVYEKSIVTDITYTLSAKRAQLLTDFIEMKEKGFTHYVIGYVRRFVGYTPGDTELSLTRCFEFTVKSSDDQKRIIPYLYETKVEAMKDFREAERAGHTDDAEYVYPAIVNGDNLKVVYDDGSYVYDGLIYEIDE